VEHRLAALLKRLAPAIAATFSEDSAHRQKVEP